jgi:peroxiredoxin
VQFVQLQDNLEAFRKAGIEVVALTYDEPKLQKKFIDKYHIGYPFLSDVDVFTVKALGILNEELQPGDMAYGVPHPGIFIVNPELEIVGKIFVGAYQKRVDSEGVLDYAVKLLN